MSDESDKVKVTDTPTDTPATDTPVPDTSATDTPATDTPVTGTPTDTPATDTPVTGTPADTPATKTKGKDKRKRVPNSLQGDVVSAAADKTITVLVERKIKHPLYKKYIRRSTKVHAHDEDNRCQTGDTVIIKSCRPLSKLKSWRLVEVVSKAA